jgi:hypothetical protein
VAILHFLLQHHIKDHFIMSTKGNKGGLPPRNETTGSKAASNAGKVLSNPSSSKAAKSAAASALTQVVKKK